MVSLQHILTGDPQHIPQTNSSFMTAIDNQRLFSEYNVIDGNDIAFSGANVKIGS